MKISNVINGFGCFFGGLERRFDVFFEDDFLG
jgi:hypothetical protein